MSKGGVYLFEKGFHVVQAGLKVYVAKNNLELLVFLPWPPGVLELEAHTGHRTLDLIYSVLGTQLRALCNQAALYR